MTSNKAKSKSRFYLLLSKTILIGVMVGTATLTSAATVSGNIISLTDEDVKKYGDVNITSNTDNKNPTNNEPPNILVYNKEFAHRIGLDESKALDLDPGIFAISIVFKKIYYFKYLPDDPFVKRHNIMSLSQEEGDILNKHLEVLPLLFKGEKIPLDPRYECYVNFYLNSDDPKVKDIKIPEERMWEQETMDKMIEEMIIPVAEKKISPIQDPDPKIAQTSKDMGMLYSLYDYFGDHFEISRSVGFLAKSYRDIKRPYHNANLAYQSHYKNFIPKVTFLSFSESICSQIRDASGKDGTYLWLLKESAKDFNPNFHKRDMKNLKESDLFKFKIPKELTESPVLKKVISYDDDQASQDLKMVLGN